MDSSLEILPIVNQSFTPPSRLGSALGATVAFIFIVFGILGDSLIILAILSKRELRNNMVNIFIVSLQLNDLFNIGFNQFLVGLSYLFMKWHGPYIICELFVYTSIICTGALLWHHALIAIHRYLVVVCNFKINHFKRAPKFYALMSVIIPRLIPTMVCAPALYSRNMTVYSSAALRCMLAPGVSALQNLLIVLINMLLPCLIVLFCFATIFARVRSVSKNVQMGSRHGNKGAMMLNSNQKSWSPQLTKDPSTHKNSVTTTNTVSSLHSPSPIVNGKSKPGTHTTFAMSLASMHREIQISKMFAIIFTVFLFGYLPYGIIRLIDSKNSLNPDVYVMLTVFFIISISISPIIYGLMNKQIKHQCVVLIRRLFRCRTTLKPTQSNENCQRWETFAGTTNGRINKNDGLRTPPLTPANEEYDIANKCEQENLLLSSSLPQLNTIPKHLNHVKECNSLTASSSQQAQQTYLDRKKSTSMSQRFKELFKPSSRSLEKTGGLISSEAEKTSLSSPMGKAHNQLSESLNQSNLLILAEDDGGVYKGPPGN